MYRFQNILSVIVFAIGIFIADVTAQVQNIVVDWKTYTSVGTISDIVFTGDELWAASNGGVLRFPTSAQNITTSDALEKFTNTEGLSGNDVVAVEIDSKNNSVWFALSNGDLNRYLPEETEQNRWQYVTDYRGQEIQDFAVFGDSIYVALDIGVSLYLIDREEVKETYRNLGLSPPNNPTNISANHIFLNGTDIWVSTDKGLAQSSLLLDNLQAPALWNTFTQSNGLPNNFINELVVFEGVPYAATRSGLVKYVEGNWLMAGLSDEVYELDLVSGNSFPGGETILALQSNGVYWYDQASDGWSLLGGSLSNVTTLNTDSEGNIWIGRQDVGLGKFNFSAQTWEFVPNNGPSPNNFESMDIDSKGRLWAASRGVVNGGIQLFDNGVWTKFSAQNGLPANDFMTIRVDAEDNVWAGSWGGGLVRINGNDLGIMRFDATDDILAGFSAESPNFVLIPYIFTDNSNNLWILNRQAINTRVVAVHTDEDDFLYFSTTQGIRSPFLTAGIVDQFGRVWLGTEDRGVQVLDLNETLSDQSDDDYTQGLIGDELFSNQINAIAEDDDGTIWIGTDAGLNFWFGGNSGEEFDIPVNVIGIDGVNNKWIGTDKGITVLKGHFDKVGDITTGNSQLVADRISAFAFDYETGVVWIGTDRGLSWGQTLFKAPREDYQFMRGYPNPYIIVEGASLQFTITELATGSEIKIFDSSGRLIRELIGEPSFGSEGTESEIKGGQAFWDGTNNKGELVASGIYVYIAYNDNQQSGVGKVAVIRR